MKSNNYVIKFSTVQEGTPKIVEKIPGVTIKENITEHDKNIFRNDVEIYDIFSIMIAKKMLVEVSSAYETLNDLVEVFRNGELILLRNHKKDLRNENIS